jgi:flagellar export protein FliJ
MIKAFRFRLDRLLSVRRVEEREAEGRARDAAHGLRRAEEECDALRDARTEALAEVTSSAAKAGARPDGPRLALEFAARLDDAFKRSEGAREIARRKAAEAEASWRRARTARRALEEIEQRAREEWRARAARDEAAFLDEVAAGRFAAARRS